MTKDEALKLALEALEYIHEGANNQGPHTGISWRCVSNKAEPAITAIKEALAQPEHDWTPERIAGMSRLKDAQDKKLTQPSVSVEKKLSSFQEEELMQQQVKDFMRSH